MSVIMLIMITLPLTTCQNNEYPVPSTVLENQQQNESISVAAYPHLVDAPIRRKCPQNHQQDKHGICRPLLS